MATELTNNEIKLILHKEQIDHTEKAIRHCEEQILIEGKETKWSELKEEWSGQLKRLLKKDLTYVKDV